MIRAADLRSMNRRELRAVLDAGHPIEPQALGDREYRGVSLGLPGWVDKLAWKKFKKVFHSEPSGALRGWNVRIVQNDLDDTYVAEQRGGRPRTFGHFLVVSEPGPHKGGVGRLLLDYGRGARHKLDPLRVLRDPLVAVNAGSVELLLGWSYLDLGFARVPTPSFFSLEREGALSHVAAPPPFE